MTANSRIDIIPELMRDNDRFPNNSSTIPNAINGAPTITAPTVIAKKNCNIPDEALKATILPAPAIARKTVISAMLALATENTLNMGTMYNNS